MRWRSAAMRQSSKASSAAVQIFADIIVSSGRADSIRRPHGGAATRGRLRQRLDGSRGEPAFALGVGAGEHLEAIAVHDAARGRKPLAQDVDLVPALSLNLEHFSPSLSPPPTRRRT